MPYFQSPTDFTVKLLILIYDVDVLFRSSFFIHRKSDHYPLDNISIDTRTSSLSPNNSPFFLEQMQHSPNEFIAFFHFLIFRSISLFNCGQIMIYMFVKERQWGKKCKYKRRINKLFNQWTEMLQFHVLLLCHSILIFEYMPENTWKCRELTAFSNRSLAICFDSLLVFLFFANHYSFAWFGWFIYMRYSKRIQLSRFNLIRATDNPSKPPPIESKASVFGFWARTIFAASILKF